MNAPIFDFLKKYDESGALRLHMPGHKGKGKLGVENLDLTEISGADSLFDANGIIAESEQNASSLFGVETFYSTEGSSLAIRAMLYLCLQYAKSKGQKPFILAGRNAHKSFISGLALLDFKVKWLYSSKKDGYLSCKITASKIDKTLSKLKQKPVAVYLTSPDYLGNILDISSISKVCKKHGVLLLIDCAHGSYLRFLKESKFPTDLGADMCCSSAHKTLPVLTGGAYLHISANAPKVFCHQAENAMSLFASTSPSYLIMQSLDYANKYIAEGYKARLAEFCKKLGTLKSHLAQAGYTLIGNEPLKLTVSAKAYGYKGDELANILLKERIVCEFSDPDYLVLMFTPENSDEDLNALEKALLQIEKKDEIKEKMPFAARPAKALSPRQAMLAPCERVKVIECKGRVLASANVSCPPAIPILVCGEVIDESAVSLLNYYGITECDVVI